MELLSYPLLDASAQTKIEGFLAEVTVVGLGDEVKNLAIRLRREHQLKLPDAIVAATALSLGAPLLTNDIKLLRDRGFLPRNSSSNKLRSAWCGHAWPIGDGCSGIRVHQAGARPLGRIEPPPGTPDFQHELFPPKNSASR